MRIIVGVDILGNPYAVEGTTTNISVRDGVIQMFSNRAFMLPQFDTVLCDGGYTGEDFAVSIFDITGARVEVAKRSKLHKIMVIPKRWIVERSFAWLDKCRRL